MASTLWTAQDSQARSPHPPCCFLLQHTLVGPPQSSSPLLQTLSQQLHPPQRHQRHFKQHLNTTGHPNFPYHTSLDIKSLYTSCDTKKSLSTTILHFQGKPHLLPPNISASTIQSLISFCLDNSYFEFNGQFYSQDTEGTMGSSLVVKLAEIRVADVENTALTTYKDPPNTYRRFFDDGIGDFRDKSHADGFLNYLNSLTDDLQYTIEYPSHDGSLPYMDILIPHTRRQIQKTYTHQPLCPL